MQTNHHWANDSLFYHIYPLGFCGAPSTNDFSSTPIPRLESIYGWFDHLQYLGVNALYLGPLFESSAHGYDTADYYQVDRRLGDRQTLSQLVGEAHRRGMRVILDGVFNHVGRHFWAFRHLQEWGARSAYQDWFVNVDFSNRNGHGDAFIYEGWEGHDDLVKLNLQNPAVVDHLLKAVEMWVQEFDIDGLRLDVAYCLDRDFLHRLAAFSRSHKSDFWLLGEMIHGDYTRLANHQLIDSVTNYECYKGLYSSHVDKNFFEIAYALNRQFGKGGIYHDLPLYNFVDNHDVNRVASQLTDPAHLTTLYTLLFTMPGVPSIYYGSEFGLTGKKESHSDAALRPCLNLSQLQAACPQPTLPAWIAKLAQVRRETPAFRYGDYQQLYVSHQQFAFIRRWEGQYAIVILNAAGSEAEIAMPSPQPECTLTDWLHDNVIIQSNSSSIAFMVPPFSAHIFVKKQP
ncbi:MAG: cyclomaltodextrinase [Anaerolineales bacterium]|nr:cyclomaltodextrinase [Anaerolineales bacterium]